MIQPKDVMQVENEQWEDFKKEAVKDELYYNGPGDLLDTAEGTAFAFTLEKAKNEDTRKQE